MIEATVCHLLRGSNGTSQMLLGERSGTSFCDGRWAGVGGKLWKNEKIHACLRREVEEEIAVTIRIKSALHFASVDFYHPAGSEDVLKWRVHYFTATKWKGEPKPVEGFSKLDWFTQDELPYQIMMPGIGIWMPVANNGKMSGKVLMAEIFYGDAEMSFVKRSSFKLVPLALAA